MWPSSVEENLSSSSNSTGLRRGSSASSSSFSSSSTSSSYYASGPRPMEDVWKDISLSSLNDHPSKTLPNAGPTFPAMILPDFLARPFVKEPQTKMGSDRYGPPATFLTLNHPGPEFESQTLPDSGSFNYRTFVGSLEGEAVNVKENKRKMDPSGNAGDRRLKRMIKNRESAARSRARKQAYTSELELEVDKLMKENARLKQQQPQESPGADDRHSKKQSLKRTLTAPF